MSKLLPDDALICFPEEGCATTDEAIRSRLLPMTQWLLENKSLFENKTILDLGSNAGHFPITYARLGAQHVTAVEGRKVFSKFFKQSASNLFPKEVEKITWICSDVRKFTPARSYDVLSCYGLIYHLSDGWRHLKRIVDQSRAKLLLFDSQIWPTEDSGIESSLTSTMTCLNPLERVPHPSFESVQSVFSSFGWNAKLALKNWTTDSRGFWVVNT